MSRLRSPRTADHREAGRGSLWALLALCAALAAGGAGTGCASTGGREHDPWTHERSQAAEALEAALAAEPDPSPGSAGSPRSAGSPGSPGPRDLQIRLAFGAGADLDLYVTDTLHESIYFARRETRSGGRLGSDARCGDAAPRIETAVFPAAAAGRYRIGIDYPAACNGGDLEPFALEVRYAGRRWTRHGLSEPLHFAPAVWEFRVLETQALEVDVFGSGEAGDRSQGDQAPMVK